MNNIKPLHRIILASTILIVGLIHTLPAQKKESTQWIVADILNNENAETRVLGHPTIIDSPYGKAVVFNGINDAIFLNQMPLYNLKKYTLEAIVRMDEGGKFEQRFLHIGSSSDQRVLLEMRSVDKEWYFDAYIKSGETKIALIDSTRLHPHNQWVHVAFVVNNGKLSTFINGKNELNHQIKLYPLKDGITSIGVRQNEVSWFKGAIYKFIISPKALKPSQFTMK